MRHAGTCCPHPPGGTGCWHNWARVVGMIYPFADNLAASARIALPGRQALEALVEFAFSGGRVPVLRIARGESVLAEAGVVPDAGHVHQPAGRPAFGQPGGALCRGCGESTRLVQAGYSAACSGRTLAARTCACASARMACSCITGTSRGVFAARSSLASRSSASSTSPRGASPRTARSTSASTARRSSSCAWR